MSQDGVVSQWLQRIGLEYASDEFRRRGISTPKALMELTMQDYEHVVKSPDDRKRLFELINRVREAHKKQKTTNDSHESAPDARPAAQYDDGQGYERYIGDGGRGAPSRQSIAVALQHGGPSRLPSHANNMRRPAAIAEEGDEYGEDDGDNGRYGYAGGYEDEGYGDQSMEQNTSMEYEERPARAAPRARPSTADERPIKPQQRAPTAERPGTAEASLAHDTSMDNGQGGARSSRPRMSMMPSQAAALKKRNEEMEAARKAAEAEAKMYARHKDVNKELAGKKVPTREEEEEDAAFRAPAVAKGRAGGLPMSPSRGKAVVPVGVPKGQVRPATGAQSEEEELSQRDLGPAPAPARRAMVSAGGRVPVASPPRELAMGATFGMGSGFFDASGPRIKVVVRKRPMARKEASAGELDVARAISKRSLQVHEIKRKVDLTRYTEVHEFSFDDVFDETVDTEYIYQRTAAPLIGGLMRGANATCFAYGQTGSGKTFTMMGDLKEGRMAGADPYERKNPGLYVLAARDLFRMIQGWENRNAPLRDDSKKGTRRMAVVVSFFEIYGGKLFDLLDKRKELKALVDAQGDVNVVGLMETQVTGVEPLLGLIDQGLKTRSTGSTGANEDSSRSHACLQITIAEAVANGPEKKGMTVLIDPRTRKAKAVGKFSVIDLAGSERGADTTHNNQKTRREGAEINKSLLALKECIRSLYQEADYNPFRGSKLTQVLKDSFIGDSRTVMIATVSPNMSNTEHTLNTLRYAYRVKEIRRDDQEDGRKERPHGARGEPGYEDDVTAYLANGGAGSGGLSAYLAAQLAAGGGKAAGIGGVGSKYESAAAAADAAAAVRVSPLVAAEDDDDGPVPSSRRDPGEDLGIARPKAQKGRESLAPAPSAVKKAGPGIAAAGAAARPSVGGPSSGAGARPAAPATSASRPAPVSRVAQVQARAAPASAQRAAPAAGRGPSGKAPLAPAREEDEEYDDGDDAEASMEDDDQDVRGARAPAAAKKPAVPRQGASQPRNVQSRPAWQSVVDAPSGEPAPRSARGVDQSDLKLESVYDGQGGKRGEPGDADGDDVVLNSPPAAAGDRRTRRGAGTPDHVLSPSRVRGVGSHVTPASGGSGLTDTPGYEMDSEFRQPELAGRRGPAVVAVDVSGGPLSPSRQRALQQARYDEDGDDNGDDQDEDLSDFRSAGPGSAMSKPTPAQRAGRQPLIHRSDDEDGQGVIDEEDEDGEELGRDDDDSVPPGPPGTEPGASTPGGSKGGQSNHTPNTAAVQWAKQQRQKDAALSVSGQPLNGDENKLVHMHANMLDQLGEMEAQERDMLAGGPGSGSMVSPRRGLTRGHLAQYMTMLQDVLNRKFVLIQELQAEVEAYVSRYGAEVGLSDPLETGREGEGADESTGNGQAGQGPVERFTRVPHSDLDDNEEGDDDGGLAYGRAR